MTIREAIPANDYMYFTSAHRKISQCKSAYDTGFNLVNECLERVSRQSDFSPSLWVLWVSDGWKSQELLLGVCSQTGKIPLIGSSVSACLFGGGIHDDGIVLLCLASPFLKASVAVAKTARQNPQRCVRSLVNKLELEGKNKNLLGSRTLLTFIPGLGNEHDFDSYKASDLHHELLEETKSLIPIVGGISTSTESGDGFQFINNKVYTNSVVAALIETDLCIGYGMSHGLTPSDKMWHVTQPLDPTKEIEQFDSGSPKTLLKGEKEPYIFGIRLGKYSEHVIYQGFLQENGNLKFRKPLPAQATLNLMTPDLSQMKDNAFETKNWAIERAGIRKERVRAIIGISCRGRRKLVRESGLEVSAVIEEARQEHQNADIVGCYLDGELGLDHNGRSRIGCWGVSEIILSDQIAAGTQLYKNLYAYTRVGKDIAGRESIDKAMNTSIRVIKNSGFQGGMISLLLPNNEKKYIVGQKAFGKGWREVVGMTKREIGGDDILALVAKTAESIFIRDSEEIESKCDRDAVIKSGVISQYVAVLNDGKEILGTLQIDMGDMRYTSEPSEEQKLILNGLVNFITSTLSHAMSSEILEFTKIISEKFNECLNMESSPSNGDVEEMINTVLQSMVETAVEALDGHQNRNELDMAHLRLLGPDNKYLKLRAGIGQYYNIINSSESTRKSIPIDTLSPTGRVFGMKLGSSDVINDKEKDAQSLEMMNIYKGTAIGEALDQHKCFANIVFGDPRGTKLGTLSVGTSSREWFFTQKHIVCFEILAERIGLLVSHLRKREKNRLDNISLKYVKNVAPNFASSKGLQGITKAQIQHIGEIFDAVVSCYLWDMERGRYVLQAQHGWAIKNAEDYIGAASYLEDEGFTGTMASSSYRGEPKVISNLAKYKKVNKLGISIAKFSLQMFGRRVDNQNETCEVIMLPLRITSPEMTETLNKKKGLGVITIHRLKKKDEPCYFSSPTGELLRQATESLNTFILAQMSLEKYKWQKEEQERLVSVKGVGLPKHKLKEMLKVVCKEICKQYTTKDCAIYLWNDENKSQPFIPPPFVEKQQGKTSPIKKPCENQQQLVKKCYLSLLDDPHAPLCENRCPKPSGNESDAKPEDLARWNRVSAVAVPLRDSNKPVGILYLRWSCKRTDKNSNGHLIRHDPQGLEELANIVTNCIRRQRQQTIEKENDEILIGLGVAMGIDAHEPANRLNEMQSLLENIDETEDLKQVREETKKLQKLICDFTEELESSEECASRFKNPVIMSINLRDMIDQAVESCSLRQKIDSNRIRLDIPNDCTEEIDSDFVLIDLVLSHLLDNACESYGKDSHPDISISITEIEEGKKICITITDTGKGMTKWEIRKAMTSLFTTKDKSGLGHGLGVPLAVAATKRIGGILRYDLEKKEGTSVIISLPLKKEY